MRIDEGWKFTEPVSAKPGERGSITLLHNVLDQIVEVPQKSGSTFDVELVGFECDKTFWGFGIRSSDGEFRLIRSMSLPQLFRAAAGIQPLTESDFLGSEFGENHLGEKIKNALRGETWVPKHDEAIVPFKGVPPIRANASLEGGVKVKSIGRISVGSGL